MKNSPGRLNCTLQGPASAQGGGWLWGCTHRGQGQGWHPPRVPGYPALTLFHPRTGCSQFGFFPNHIFTVCQELWHISSSTSLHRVVALTTQTHLHQALLEKKRRREPTEA